MNKVDTTKSGPNIPKDITKLGPAALPGVKAKKDTVIKTIDKLPAVKAVKDSTKKQ